MIKNIREFLLNFITRKKKCPCYRRGKLEGKRIVVDPGHGLYEKSRNGSNESPIYVYQREEYDGIREDLITVEVAEHLIAMLEKEGAEVTVTRSVGNNRKGVSGHPKWMEGAHMSLNASGKSSYKNDTNIRWAKANEWNEEYPVDLLLSLHFNAGGGRGAETWYYKGNEETQIIAQNIQFYTIHYTGARNRGIKPSSKYAILKYSNMPCIIWEGLFFDNKHDIELLKKDEYYYDAARALCDGILKSVEEGLL